MADEDDDPRGSGRAFNDRREAGFALAGALLRHRTWQAPVVLALPRGGVPVAAEVARRLGAPLDVLVVRKLGHPRHEEYAVGAIAGGGVRVMNPEAAHVLGGLAAGELDRVIEREQRELQRRQASYRGDRPAVPVQGREVILVDDGLATGATMRAAVRAVRQLGPARVTVAVPVGARDSCEALRDEADEVVCVRMPEPFRAVGLWYADFAQTSDEEVRALLEAAQHPGKPAG